MQSATSERDLTFQIGRCSCSIICFTFSMHYLFLTCRVAAQSMLLELDERQSLRVENLVLKHLTKSLLSKACSKLSTWSHIWKVAAFLISSAHMRAPIRKNLDSGYSFHLCMCANWLGMGTELKKKRCISLMSIMLLVRLVTYFLQRPLHC